MNKLLFTFLLIGVYSCTTSKNIERNTILETTKTKRYIDTTFNFVNPIKPKVDSAKFTDTLRIITKDYEIKTFVDTTKKKVYTKVKPTKKVIPIPIKIKEETEKVKEEKNYTKTVERNFKELEKLIGFVLIGFIFALVIRYYLKKFLEKW